MMLQRKRVNENRATGFPRPAKLQGQALVSLLGALQTYQLHTATHAEELRSAVFVGLPITTPAMAGTIPPPSILQDSWSSVKSGL